MSNIQKTNSKSKKIKEKPKKTTTNSKFIVEAIEFYKKDKDLSLEEIKKYFNLEGDIKVYLTDSKCKLIKKDFEKLYPIIREYYNFPENQERRDEAINRNKNVSLKKSKYCNAIDILEKLPEDLLEYFLGILKALPIKK